MTVRKQLNSAQLRLAEQPSARLEAEILLAHCLEAPRSFLYANPDLELSNQRREQFHTLVERRVRGEPIAYIIGQREFWSLPIRVTPDVLIPRPESELLVERALEAIPPDAAWRIADLGTGSGALALAIASERRNCSVYGTDSSAAAIDVAVENARRLGIGNTHFLPGSWGAPLEGRFRVIVSNPPYVAEDDRHLDEGDCRFEPRQALTPGPDALAAIRDVAGSALARLEDGGWLFLEHGPEQGADVRSLLRDRGYREVATVQDLLGQDRIACGRRPE